MAIVQTEAVPAYTAVTATSAEFATTLVAGATYVIVSTTAAWVLLHATAATAVVRTAGNHAVGAGQPFTFTCQGAMRKIAIVRDAADGFASLSLS